MPTPIDNEIVTSSGTTPTLTFTYANIVGLANGQILTVGVANLNSITPGAPEWDTPAGWNKRYEVIEEGGTDVYSAMYWKVASDETGTEVFTASSAIAGSGRVGVMQAFSGVDTITPFDVAYNTAQNVRTSNNNQPDPATITTVTDNALVGVFSTVSADDITAWIASTNHTLLANNVGTETNLGLQYREIPTAGVEDPSAWNNTDNGTNAAEGNTHTFALRPAAVGGVSITDVDTDEIIQNGQTGIDTITTGAEASQGTGSIALITGAISAAQTITAWGELAQTFSFVQGDNPFDTASYQNQIKITNNSAETDTINVSSIPEANTAVVELSSPLTGTGYIESTPAAVTGDQFHYQSILYLDGVPTAYTISIAADAEYIISGDPPDGVYTIKVRHWNQTNWGVSDIGSGAIQTFTIGSGSGSSQSANRVNGRGIYRAMSRMLNK